MTTYRSARNTGTNKTAAHEFRNASIAPMYTSSKLTYIGLREYRNGPSVTIVVALPRHATPSGGDSEASRQRRRKIGNRTPAMARQAAGTHHPPVPAPQGLCWCRYPPGACENARYVRRPRVRLTLDGFQRFLANAAVLRNSLCVVGKQEVILGGSGSP